MIADSLILRGTTFAFLFGPPRYVDRRLATEIFQNVCGALSLDDLIFQYIPQKPDTGEFAVTMNRQEGRGLFQITLDTLGPGQPMRLALNYDWAPSFRHIEERFDLASAGVFQTLEPFAPVFRVLAEVTLRSQISVSANDAPQFIKNNLLALPEDFYEGFGLPTTFLALRVGSINSSHLRRRRWHQT